MKKAVKDPISKMDDKNTIGSILEPDTVSKFLFVRSEPTIREIMNTGRIDIISAIRFEIFLTKSPRDSEYPPRKSLIGKKIKPIMD